LGLSAVFYLWLPAIPLAIATRLSWLHRLLEEKYFLDAFNHRFFAQGAHGVGLSFWRRGDQGLIDGFLVNGSARFVAILASILRLGQTGFLYHYAIAMILGVALLLWWFAPLSVGPVAVPR
ncbi:MAG: NADH-quinone oxidoreductase subunit L, partial [Burkholderiaceae bacterium]|nr:NADH-quinone oxidoreductase subunit L [Burkholderiaceae bacterium]